MDDFAEIRDRLVAKKRLITPNKWRKKAGHLLADLPTGLEDLETWFPDYLDYGEEELQRAASEQAKAKKDKQPKKRKGRDRTITVLRDEDKQAVEVTPEDGEDDNG